MKLKAFIASILVGLACLALSIALIVVAGINQRQQARLQARQQQLNSGLMGQQAQQISGQVLQELANAAATNMAIRDALVNRGYQLSTPSASAPQGEKAEGP